MNEISCQCPTYGRGSVNRSLYEPEELKVIGYPEGNCPGDYGLELYERDGQELWLCSCCFMLGDKKLSKTVALASPE